MGTTVEGRISFTLSEKGRKRLLLAGGGSAPRHISRGQVGETDVDLFDVAADGTSLTFDVCNVPDPPPNTGKYEIFAAAGAGYDLFWHIVPSWDELLELTRWVRDWSTKREREEFDAQLASDKDRAEVVARFLSDPGARAENVPKKGGGPVTINGYVVHDPEVVEEANTRKQRDADEKRAAQWEVLSKWIKEHGSENQSQRLEAGFLPFDEAYKAMENHVFAPLVEFPQHKRFAVKEVCKCIEYEIRKQHCKPRFESKDATELGPEEWQVFQRIRAALPNAKFQFRIHEAECDVSPPQRRYGAIVKLGVKRLGFKREYALCPVEIP